MLFGSLAVEGHKCKFSLAIIPRKIENLYHASSWGSYFWITRLISSRSFQGGKTLEIYGPKGIEEYVRTSLNLSKSRLGYPLKFIEVQDKEVVFKDNQFKSLCRKTDHGILSYGYRMRQILRRVQLNA